MRHKHGGFATLAVTVLVLLLVAALLMSSHHSLCGRGLRLSRLFLTDKPIGWPKRGSIWPRVCCRPIRSVPPVTPAGLISSPGRNGSEYRWSGAFPLVVESFC